MTPNIFQYATKELSQDAMIGWLVACGRKPSGDRRECGLAFVRPLMQSRKGCVINASSGELERNRGEYEVIEVLRDPAVQYRKIDVYFQADVDGGVRWPRAGGTAAPAEAARTGCTLPGW